jgi:IS605 OrfB family transposase
VTIHTADGVHRTIKLRLDTTEEHEGVLFRTMDLYNGAFDVSAQWGFRNQNCNKIDNHKATYQTVRRLFPELQSYLVEGARDLACEALKQLQCKKLPKRGELASIRYHRKAAGVYLRSGYAKLSTIDGRLKVPFHLAEYHEKYMDWVVRSSNLTYDRGLRAFFLCVVMESTSLPPTATGPVLGIDRGVTNIAVTSANQFFSAKMINGIRGKYAYLQGQLQSKGTRSAKRKLRKMSGRERRFKADVNHCIAKEIVESPYATFTLEDLKGINQKKMRKRRGSEWMRKLNGNLASWNYNQLERFIRYKAEEVGKSMVIVPGRNTSITCSRCGYRAKKNRHRHEFHCAKCGFQLHADLNAARNIACLGISEISRLPVNQPNVTSGENKNVRGQLRAPKWSG